jgi:hypothetical protein
MQALQEDHVLVHAAEQRRGHCEQLEVTDGQLLRPIGRRQRGEGVVPGALRESIAAALEVRGEIHFDDIFCRRDAACVHAGYLQSPRM